MKVIVLGLILVILGAFGVQMYKDAERKRLHEEAVAAAEQATREREAAELARRKQVQAQQDEIDKAVAAARMQYLKWQDASRLAGSTGRIALAGPVATLQSIRRETEAMLVPPCFDKAKAALVNGMAAEIDGFVLFMQNTLNLGDALAAPSMQKARDAFAIYEANARQCEGAASAMD